MLLLTQMHSSAGITFIITGFPNELSKTTMVSNNFQGFHCHLEIMMMHPDGTHNSKKG